MKGVTVVVQLHCSHTLFGPWRPLDWVQPRCNNLNQMSYKDDHHEDEEEDVEDNDDKYLYHEDEDEDK